MVPFPFMACLIMRESVLFFKPRLFTPSHIRKPFHFRDVFGQRCKLILFKLTLNPSWEPHHKMAHPVYFMHMPNLKHEFSVRPHILAQVIICCIHKVTKFSPWDVVGILWNEFQLNAFLKKFPCVAMGFPFL